MQERVSNERGRQLSRPYRMNTRISSTVETSVYVLATAMTPRYSGLILSSILQGKRLYTENGTQYPGMVYSELNTPLLPSTQADSLGLPPLLLALAVDCVARRVLRFEPRP
jgi:hypothetical protein